MLKLDKYSENSAHSFHGQIEKVLGKQGEVKSRKQGAIIECKDLDEVTSRKDVCFALRKLLYLSGIWHSAIKRMKRMGVDRPPL